MNKRWVPVGKKGLDRDGEKKKKNKGVGRNRQGRKGGAQSGKNRATSDMRLY